MASESIHKQDFLVRNLPTRSVVLFPTRAQIVRDIAGVSLKPGQNQIIIEGITPTVDEHSIKVEGTGTATITDLSVQLVSNKDIFEEIYPSDDEDSDDSDIDSDEQEDEDEAIKALRKENTELSTSLADETEKLNSATARLAMLDKFSNSVEAKPPSDIGGVVSNYREERIKIYDDHKAASNNCNSLRVKITRNNRKVQRLGQAAAKAAAKAMKEKQKQQAAKQRKKNEVLKEKARIRTEREKFWPKKVYKVVISLDAPSGATPATSRRNSIDSLVKVSSPGEASATASDMSNLADINLSLSYITYSASWLPRYDLSLNTVTQNGVLDFQAELKNTTCEAWRDAKIILSTSQTSYQGLDETIPILQPWHVRLAKNNYNAGAALYSRSEQEHSNKNKKEIPPNVQAPRNQLFGRDAGPVYNQHEYEKKRKSSAPSGGQQQDSRQYLGFGGPRPAPGGSIFSPPLPKPSSQGLFGGSFNTATSQDQNRASLPVASSRGGLFNAAQNLQSNSLFGRANAIPAPPAPSALYSSMQQVPMRSLHRSANTRERQYLDIDSTVDEDEEGGDGGADEDGATLNSPDLDLLFEESSTSETGLTTTYDLPSVKTLIPSSNTIKHKIARLEFRSIIFSHILIPKLRAAAFLKARLRNASKLTLLKGTAGLTLDGSFLGQSTIPRCSAGESFSLPLGVDPSINVVYAKPTVRRSQSGIFSKEDCEVFTRTAVVTNTKGNAPVELTVLDQIPVSEDERLKVEIQVPRGLRIGGEVVNAGVGTGTNAAADGSAANKARLSVYGDDASGKSGKWGSATAVAKKGGEVTWQVKINPTKGCKLVLEYEATYPGGETVVAVN